jgi:hypothetical protein
MKRVLLLLSIVWLFVTSASLAKKRSDYAGYFEGILKAEHLLATNQLPACLDAYAAIFKEYDFIFARDAYNALQLAILTKNAKQQDALVTLCGKSGLPQYLFYRNALVHKVYAGDSTRFRALYATGNAIYRTRIDTALRSEMQRRFNLEQAAKGQSNYKAICTDNFNRIVELSKQGRFPAEQLIGVNDDLGYGFSFPTLLHYPYAYVLLNDYLWAAVHKGQLQPLSLIYLYGFNKTRTSVLYTDDIPVDTQHFKVQYTTPDPDLVDETEVDNARKKVWLRPQSETQMIINVAREHGMDFREGW